MKTIMALCLVLFAVPAMATEYYFKVGTVATNMMGSFTRPSPEPLNRSEEQILIAVTEAQYGTGSQADYDALPVAVVAAGIDAARTEAANYDKWRDQEKALARLFVKEINKLRALYGLPPYTAAQVKAALKAEMND